MGLFHKISVFFKRAFSAKSLPKIDGIKRYGNKAEDDFEQRLVKLIPNVKYKRNVFIDAPTGKCEIDFLINYKNKLFIVEVKHYKGRVYGESDGNFIKYKQDTYTDDIHVKEMKNPFRQVNRQASLIKEMTHSHPWINTIVYFYGTKEIFLQNDRTWFTDINDVADYIKNDGCESYQDEIKKCFSRCKSLDYVVGGSFGNTIRCNVSDSSFAFCGYKKEDIKRLDIEHFFTYDNVHVCLKADL